MTRTPETWEMRDAWAAYDGYDITLSQYADLARAEFDRWLVEVKAEAWDEGFVAGVNADYEHPPEIVTNPYRTKEDNND